MQNPSSMNPSKTRLAKDRALDLACPVARLRDACDRAQALAADLAAQVTAAERILAALMDALEADGGDQ